MIWEYVDSVKTKDRLKELDITNDTIKDRIYKYYENFIHCKFAFYVHYLFSFHANF